MLDCRQWSSTSQTYRSTIMADPERTRLVVLGDAGVGKSAICKRFLYNTFCPKYKTTVEDLYSKEFNVGTAQQLKVNHFYNT